MALIVCDAVTNVVDKQISDRSARFATFTKQHTEGVLHSCELIAGCGGIVKEVKYKLWVKPEA